jgi:hypothetical protein
MSRLDMLTDTAADALPSEFAEKIPLADTAGGWNRHGRRPARRNRKWEKEHRPYRYVNVPPEVRDHILALAQHLNVTADEVARACLEYGLGCVDEKKLGLQTRPNPLGRKMTLFPHDQARGWKEANGPHKEIPARRRSHPDREKKIHPAVSYRFPKPLHENCVVWQWNWMCWLARWSRSFCGMDWSRIRRASYVFSRQLYL